MHIFGQRFISKVLAISQKNEIKKWPLITSFQCIEDLTFSVHVLLNLLNELVKRDKNARFSEHFISFCNEFNKFNDTGARMLYPIYQITIKLFFLNRVFARKR